MPVIWDAATYAKAYSYPDPDNRGVKLSYGLKWAQCIDGPNDRNTYNFHLNRLNGVGAAIPGVGPNADILIVGCGFGYTIAEAIKLGYGNTWGDDTSAYIQASKSIEAPDTNIASRILDIDVTSPTAVNQFKSAGAGNNQGKFSFILTEFVIESFDPVSENAEFMAFLNGLDGLKANPQAKIIHLFAGRLPPPYDQNHDASLGMTWLSLEEWMSYKPSHYWVDVHRGFDAWQGGQ